MKLAAAAEFNEYIDYICNSFVTKRSPKPPKLMYIVERIGTKEVSMHVSHIVPGGVA